MNERQTDCFSPAARASFAATLRRMANAIERGARCDGFTCERSNAGDPKIEISARLEVWVEP